jgi:copper chaperone
MTNKTFNLETLTCPSCAAKIEAAVKRLKGVDKIEVLFTSSRVKASFDENETNENEIKKTIEKLGFDVLGIK